MTLTEFLEARLADDEAAAKAWLPRVRLTGSSSWDDELNDSDLGPYSIEHIARHDPARVLREVAFKRKILDELIPWLDSAEDDHWHERGVGDQPPYEGSVLLMKLLAAVWSDHPDYDEAWR